jgi:hypothetical protein
MQLRRITVLLVGALSLGSCDLIVDKIREGGNAPGGGGSSSGPTPPPTSDAGARPDPGTPGSPPPPTPPNRCQDWTGAGDETTCKSQGEWKQYAYDACQAQKLILNDYAVGGGDCGPGMTRSVKYQCCAPEPSPTPSPQPPIPTPPPPTPPQPPTKCADTVVAGDETTCRSQDEWKLHAYEACQAQNLILSYYGVGGGDCAPGKTHQVKYQCCAPAPSVPADPGTPGSSPGTGTPGTGSTGSGACTGGTEGGETSCKSVATWRQYAMENCARQNLVLTDVGFSVACGTDFYRYMKFVCCSGK